MRNIKSLIVILSACAGVQLSACSTSASMRVEVEVYKGPLSRTLQTQVGELNGTIRTASVSLSRWVSEQGADAASQRDAVGVISIVNGISADLLLLDCGQLKELLRQYIPVLTVGNTLNIATAGFASVYVDTARDLSAQRNSSDLAVWLSSAENLSRLEELLLATSRSRSAVNIAPALTTVEANILDLVQKARVACATVFLDTKARPRDNDAVQKFAVAVATVSTRMAGAATSITTSQLLSYSKRPERREMVKLAIVLGEYANQLAARADVLSKQVIARGADPSRAAAQLSTSDYLRDASTTEFVTLMDWLDATNVDGKDYRRSDEALSDPGRVNLARQLFADQYWTRINDVYSSGQGDVRMALIKDDIGNWSQKSFDNDPTELLDAYRKVGLAALNTLAKAAKGGSVGNLQMVSDLATNRFSSTEAASEVSADLKREREQTLTRLNEIQKKATALEQKYQAKVEALLTASEAAAKKAAEDSGTADAKRKSRDVEVQKYLDAVNKPEAPAVIDNQKVIAVTAQNAYAAAAVTALASQEAATKAKADLDAVQKPYKEGMQAALDEATAELKSLSRVATALQESRSPKPVPVLPAAPAK